MASAKQHKIGTDEAEDGLVGWLAVIISEVE
jgi:hypothetical protein